MGIVKKKIEDYCNIYSEKKYRITKRFEVFDNLPPIVDVKSCFDDLRVKPDHVSRSPSDTYYIDKDKLLRTHTSAHQTALIRKGMNSFLCSGDVYRRDEIDSSHYPVFHQVFALILSLLCFLTLMFNRWKVFEYLMKVSLSNIEESSSSSPVSYQYTQDRKQEQFSIFVYSIFSNSLFGGQIEFIHLFIVYVPEK